MARVTVEDCIDKVENRFDLVLLASHRARLVSSGSQITIDRDNDKNPVVALREIAEKTISPEDLKEDLIHSLQKNVEVDEPEAETAPALASAPAAVTSDAAGDVQFDRMTEEDLLRGLEITQPNQVWAMDITYIPMARGFVYLTVVLDWFSRRVLSWRVSITMEASFCVEALEEALARYGRPEIFNTDQGSQFTAQEFVQTVKEQGCKLSMDGRGAWRDNVFVERLWRSVKYEEVYLHAYESVSEARQAIDRYFRFYNSVRPHSALGSATPDSAYFRGLPLKAAA